MIDNKNNSGDYNSGNYNSGNYNSGYYNSGDYNSGNYNSGDRNSGDRNSGDYNSGDRNSGNYNSGDYNSGYFNSDSPKIRLFNKDTDLDFDSDLIQKMESIISARLTPILTWIYSEKMNDNEKRENPTHETTGGYLKKQDYKYCWEKGWGKMSKEEKDFIINLPNFDWVIFEEITGIKKVEEKQRITLELTQDQIDRIQGILEEF